MKTINLFRFLKTYFGSLRISLLRHGITKYGVKTIKSTKKKCKKTTDWGEYKYAICQLRNRLQKLVLILREFNQIN